MIVTTGNSVEGHHVIEYLGLVRGIVVRAPTISQGFVGGISKFFGGNIEAYAQACESAREESYQRMLANASKLEADAIIGMRYDATEFGDSVTEVLSYGTAVKISPISKT